MPCRVLLGYHPQIARSARENVSSDFSLSYSPLSEAVLPEVDLYLPLVLSDYDALLTTAGAPLYAKALVPARAAIEACHDKLRFARTVEAAGFAFLIPQRLAAPIAGPYVLKKRKDDFGRGTVVIDEEGDSGWGAEKLSPSDYFAQELIVGKIEYATHLLVFEGNVRYHFTAIFEMQDDRSIKGIRSNGVYRGPHDAQLLLPVFKQVLEAVGFSNGVCCIDYKLIDGQPKIFEINPRFGGSLTMDITQFLHAYRKAVQDQRSAGGWL